MEANLWLSDICIFILCVLCYNPGMAHDNNEKQCFADVVLLDCRIFQDEDCRLAAFQRVDPARQHKIEAYAAGSDRRLSLGAGLLAAYLLRTHGIDPARLSFASDGRPELTGEDAFLSLSHAGCFAMAGLSSHPIGVDIEEHQPRQMMIADHFFTPDERDCLARATDQTECFFRLWSRKECMLKRDGLADLRDISALRPQSGGTFLDFPLPGYSCVCYCNEIIRPTFHVLGRKELSL